jgi:hypothetical protein
MLVGREVSTSEGTLEGIEDVPISVKLVALIGMDEGVSERTNAGIEEVVKVGMDKGVSDGTDVGIEEGALATNEVIVIVGMVEGVSEGTEAGIDEDTIAFDVFVIDGMDEGTSKDVGIEEGTLTIMMEVVVIVGIEEGIISEGSDVGISVKVGTLVGNGVGTVSSSGVAVAGLGEGYRVKTFILTKL